MRLQKKYTQLIICIFFIFVIMQQTYAFTQITEDGIFLNTQRGTTQTISQENSESAFFTIDVLFGDSIPALIYQTVEDSTLTQNQESLEKAYRYLIFEITEQTAIDKFTLNFRVERNNTLGITPINIKLYGYTTENVWELIPHSIAYTTNSHYYFTAQAIFHPIFAISDDSFTLTSTTIMEQETNETETTKPLENEIIAIINQTQDTQQQEREYIDDAAEPNYILIIIIVISLILLIGGTILYVVAKHKIEPSKIQSVDNAALTMKVQEMIRLGKSNGEIVNDLLDQGYSLDSITQELQTAGRPI